MVEEFLRLLLCGGQDQDTVHEIACGVYCPEDHDRYAQAKFTKTPTGLQLEVRVCDAETGEIQRREQYAISVALIDTPGQAIADAKLSNFHYKKDEFRTYFTSPFEQYADHIGQVFTVLGHDKEAEKDVVVGGGNPEEMYRIRFEDGTTITAWGHEVCKLDYDKCS